MNREDAIVQAAEIAAPVFKRQGWTWSRVNGAVSWAAVPSQARIAASLFREAKFLGEHPDAIASRSGRFALEVVRDEETNEPTRVRVVLELAEWDL